MSALSLRKIEFKYLDSIILSRYNINRKGVAEKRLRPKLRFYFSNRNRHLAEWRFLLFTVTVIVYFHT